MSMKALTKNIALALTATVALTGVGATSAAAANKSPMRDVAEHVLEAGAPGYLARIDDGRRVRNTVAGLADTATGRKLKASDQFEIGSNTKTYTAVLALQLVDRGKLRLDAPIERYLPGVVPNGRNITVRMLLNHTSGLFSYTGDPDFFTDMENRPQHVYTDRELLDVAFKHDPNFAPGAGWSYSNTNYILLGMTLQKLTGRTMPQLVQERIAKPLGLKRTYYANPRATNTGPGYAHGYAVAFAGPEPVYTDMSDRPIGGWAGAAGAVISTAEDTAKFFSAVFSAKLFSRAQLQQMRTTVDVPESFGIKGAYGLGVFRVDSPCGTVWGHGGDTNGHHSTALASADGRRTAVSDTTANLAETTPNPGLERFVEVAFAAQDVTVCDMLDKPVPAEVLDRLHGEAKR